MAFDMYAEKKRESIEIHEEALFEFLGEDVHLYPKLNELWDKFYESPRFGPVASNELVHEIFKVREKIIESDQYKWLEPVLVRLAAFFSYAYTNSITVQCAGDASLGDAPYLLTLISLSI